MNGSYYITFPYVYYFLRVRIAYFSGQMLLSATIITILYIHVALVLFGILAVDGGAWRLTVPTRKSRSSIRGFFGQFSWGRPHRSSAPAADQVIDIQGHIDTTSTGVSDGSLDRGRKTKSKSVAKQSTNPEISVLDNGASSRPARLKKLAIKMLWYPTGMCHSSLRRSRLINFRSLYAFDPPHGHYPHKSVHKSQLGRSAGIYLYALVHGTLQLSVVLRVCLIRRV
jgi:hypothetical protein